MSYNGLRRFSLFFFFLFFFLFLKEKEAKRTSIRRTVLVTVFVTALLSGLLIQPVYGETTADTSPFSQILPELGERLGLDDLEKSLPEEAEEMIGQEGVLGFSPQEALSGLLAKGRKQMGTYLTEALRPVSGILAVSILCSFGDALTPKKNAMNYLNLAGCLSVAMICVGDVKSLVSMGRETMQTLTDFAAVLLPTLTSAAAFAGAYSSSAAKYAASALFLHILMTAANTLVFPLITAYLAAVFANAVLGGGALSAAVRLLKWASRFTLTALVTVFTFYLGISGLAASGADALATKAVKTVVSAALPVVGSIISDASESLVAGAGLIRSSIGIFGFLTVLAVCFAPFLRLGLRYVAFKGAAAVSAVADGGRLSGLIEGVGTAFGMVLALVGSEAVFLYLSILSLLKAVS